MCLYFLSGLQTRQEVEADNFAASFLIPRSSYKEFVANNSINKRTVKQFAQSIGVAPGIVVGRLQYDGHINYSWLNDLKVKFTLVEN